MPVHWYYDPDAIMRDFGILKDYETPKLHYPSSIMALANTGKAGRGTQDGDVIGTVILKGKKKHWGQANRHYHQRMQAGDNTFNLHCSRVLLRTLNTTRRYDPADFLRNYVEFMTTEDSHNDTYAESYDRDFFANHAKGIPAERCAGAQGHDTASIGGLVGLPLTIFSALGHSACYIEHSFPSVLYLAARYEDEVDSALVANTQVGGNNCHRGALLGAVLGAALGLGAIPKRWVQG